MTSTAHSSRIASNWPLFIVAACACLGSCLAAATPEPEAPDPEWQAVVEEFELSPFDATCAYQVVAFDRTHGRTNNRKRKPEVWYRAARALFLLHRGLALEHADAFALLDGWKRVPKDRLVDVFDTWLFARTDAQWSEAFLQNGLDMFRGRGRKLRLHPDDLNALLPAGTGKRSVSSGQHLAAARLLEMGGFYENARREYAYAGRLWHYAAGPSTPEDDPDVLAEARSGYVRMLATLEQWDDAQAALPLIKDEAAQAKWQARIEEKKPPQTLRYDPPWRRLAWQWQSTNRNEAWHVRRLDLLDEGLLAASSFDAALLDLENGAERWRFDPGKGSLRYIGTADGQAWFLHEPRIPRPDPYSKEKQAAVMWPEDADVPFRLIKVDLKTGKAAKEKQPKAQEVHILTGGVLLIKRGDAYMIEHPFTGEAAVPLDGAIYAGAQLASTGKDVLFLYDASYTIDAVSRATGKTLWHTAEKLGEVLPKATVEHIRTTRKFIPAVGQLGDAHAWQSIGTTLALRDLQTGKLLWTYLDPLMETGRSALPETAPALHGPFAVGDQPIAVAVYPSEGIVALRLDNGQPLWRATLSTLETGPQPDGNDALVSPPVLASAPLSNGEALWLTCGGLLMALNPADGHLIWSAPAEKSAQALVALRIDNAMPPRMSDDRAFLLSNHGRASAIHALRTTPRPEGDPLAEDLFDYQELQAALKADPKTSYEVWKRWPEAVVLGWHLMPERKNVLRQCALKHDAPLQTHPAVYAALGPYTDEELERVLPALRLSSWSKALLEKFRPVTTKEGFAKLADAVKARIQRSGAPVARADSQSAARAFTDARTGGSRKPPEPPPDDF